VQLRLDRLPLKSGAQRKDLFVRPVVDEDPGALRCLDKGLPGFCRRHPPFEGIAIDANGTLVFKPILLRPLISETLKSLPSRRNQTEPHGAKTYSDWR
jgi:hypothetical protein